MVNEKSEEESKPVIKTVFWLSLSDSLWVICQEILVERSYQVLWLFNIVFTGDLDSTCTEHFLYVWHYTRYRGTGPEATSVMFWGGLYSRINPSSQVVLKSRSHGLEKGSANYDPGATSGLLTVFVNKVLLKDSHVHLVMYCLWRLSCLPWQIWGIVTEVGSQSLKYLLSSFSQKCYLLHSPDLDLYSSLLFFFSTVGDLYSS